jgi:F-type H+-transporting ATPase subunit delta
LASGTTGSTDIAERYATALYEMADEAQQLDAVAEDLRGLRGMLAESDELRQFIRSPIYDRAEQTRAVLAVLEAAKVGDLTRRFVGVVGQNRRLAALPAIIDAYLETLARRRGEVTAEVSSAVALSDAQRDSLTESLRKAVGSKVVVETDVDPELIGGLVVRVGSRMFDASLRTKLQRMRLAMKGVG